MKTTLKVRRNWTGFSLTLALGFVSHCLSAVPIISTFQVTPDPMIVGSDYTVSIAGTDITRAYVTVDFRPTANKVVRLTLNEVNGLWTGTATSPQLSLSRTVPVKLQAFIFNAQGARTSQIKLVQLAPPQSTTRVMVTGRIVNDYNEPVSGATISASISGAGSGASLATFSMAGFLGGSLDWADPRVYLKPQPSRRVTSGFSVLSSPMQSTSTVGATSRLDGTFSLTIDPEELPADILITVQVQEENLPDVQTAKWVTAIATTCDAGTILVPSAQRNELIVLGGTAATEDGTLVLEELGSEVSRVFARTYDPAADPEAFPGDFTEGGRVPLNSSVFLWIEALDANGNPISDLSQAAKIKARVPRGQWIDLEDINSGTDRIEVPIYLFDEAVNQWQQQGVGWLEDAAGTALPESAEPLVIAGTFEGDIYAVFYTPHFSWLNVDYPYIGPWTLSRLNPNQRNTDCLYDAMQLARRVVNSAVGRTSLMKFNTADGDLDVELADGAGPELNSGNLAGYGQFKGNESGDRDDQFYLNNSLLDAAMGYLTTDEKSNLTVLLAVSILHETCHWKWDVKHEGGNWVNPEPGGEAGNELERDLFGGIVQGTVGGLTLDGVAVPAAVRAQWLDYAAWPQSGTPLLAQSQPAAVPSPLNIDISTPRSSYQLGEDIELLVTYQNQSSAPIKVLSLNSLEGYPVWVEVRREGDTARVPFRGVRGKRAVNFQTDFASLEPGEAIQQTLSLVRDGSGNTRYSITRSGTYHITLFYSGHWGLPQTESETITIDIGGSGGLRGQVLDTLTVNPIQGATVMVYSGLNLLLSTTTDASGYYLFPELAPGSYTIRIQADGYLRAQIDDVEVAPGETTVRNINLSPFIAEGQMRLVLTWGAAPSDLDSHLEFDGEDGSSFHVAYYDQGNILDFPWAALDVDDTSSFGPETITISQLLPGTYTYSIHHYCCGGSLATSSAQVQVFDRSGLIGTFDVPTSTSGVWWPVLRIDGATGAITPLNPFQ